MKNSHILVVDDELSVTAMLANGLGGVGARVTKATGIGEADAAIARDRFDVIISGVHLAGNEGLQWTERLLGTPSAPPILLITSRPEIVTAMRAANLPVAGYLAKPLVLSEITILVRRLLAAQRQRRALQALAAEARQLAGAGAGLPAAIASRLEALAGALTTEAARPVRECNLTDEILRQAIRDTIVVLEKTRDSFQSKELGRLRRHLQQVLAHDATA